MSDRPPRTLLTLPPELLLPLPEYLTNIRHLHSLALTCRLLHTITQPFLRKAKIHIESVVCHTYYPRRPPVDGNAFLNPNFPDLLAWGDPGVCAALAQLENEPLAASVYCKLFLPLLGEDEMHHTAYDRALGYTSDDEDEDWPETWNEAELAQYRREHGIGEKMIDRFGTRYMDKVAYQKYSPMSGAPPSIPGSLSRMLALMKMLPNVTLLDLGSEHGQPSHHIEALFCLLVDEKNLPLLSDFCVTRPYGGDPGAVRIVLVELLMKRPRMRVIDIANIDWHEQGTYDFGEGEWTSNLVRLDLGLPTHKPEPVYRDLVTLISRCPSLERLELRPPIGSDDRERSWNWGRAAVVRFYSDLLTTLLEHNTSTLTELRVSLGSDCLPSIIVPLDEDNGTGFDIIPTLQPLSAFINLRKISLPLWVLLAAFPITPEFSPGDIAILPSRLPTTVDELELPRWLENTTIPLARTAYADVTYEILEHLAPSELTDVSKLRLWELGAKSAKMFRHLRGNSRQWGGNGVLWWAEELDLRRGDPEKLADDEGNGAVA